jgi:hypothetical protein
LVELGEATIGASRKSAASEIEGQNIRIKSEVEITVKAGRSTSELTRKVGPQRQPEDAISGASQILIGR